MTLEDAGKRRAAEDIRSTRGLFTPHVLRTRPRGLAGTPSCRGTGRECTACRCSRGSWKRRTGNNGILFAVGARFRPDDPGIYNYISAGAFARSDEVFFM